MTCKYCQSKMTLEGNDYCCDDCGATRSKVTGCWTYPTINIADFDLFQCEDCGRTKDIDDSIRVAKGVLVCPVCAQKYDFEEKE